MIKANKNRLFNSIFSVYLKRLMKKHFYRIHLHGEDTLSRLVSSYPTIVYANHSNWWDGFIAYFLTSKLWKRDDYLMMDIEQMKKYSMFKYLGVFSIDRNSANETLQSVNYAASLLKDTDRFLWIFPQGKMEVQDKQPVEFLNGIAKIAEKTGQVNLLPAAFRYEFIMEQRPEVFIRIGEPDVFDGNNKVSVNSLSDKLDAELNILKNNVINNELESYNIIFSGKDSRNKTFDKLSGE